MKKTFCDCCGDEVTIGQYVITDLDENTLVKIQIRPEMLNKRTGPIQNPDLCAECIIEAIKERR